jgi:starch phosphorylase
MNSDSHPIVLPGRIGRLRELAYDLWWSWNYHAREVFRNLDYPLWRLTAHNPVHMLRIIGPERLEELTRDSCFLALYDEAIRDLDEARSAKQTWWSEGFPDLPRRLIAYFSAEFALHQSLPIYAGGLGVLAGDHCKTASDLGVPLVGVGFMYPQGYFHQNLSSEGWQLEVYEQLNWDNAPVERVLTSAGRLLMVPVPVGQRTVFASVWRVQLGGVQLFLLDTGLDENAPVDRNLSARLYGGDREVRLQQEIVLGIGGVRALRALGIKPDLWHLNEGHAAFVAFERIRELIEQGSTLDTALQEVRYTTVFTTHTPVPAGHDAFPLPLVEAYLEGWWHADARSFLDLGNYDNGTGPLLNMTVLALRTSGELNAVSQLHRQVTSDMWAPIWPEVPAAERPVKTVTNGVHVATWIAPAVVKLFERYLGADWQDRHDEEALWDAIADIPDEELWNVRQSLRNYLIAFTRERARQRWMEEHVDPVQVVAAGTLLDPSAMTIGFARRFTGYKRPELIFHDPQRLAAILDAPRRPVQIIFAGKAHPADDVGKHHLMRVYQHAVNPVFAGRVAFVDDYDLHVAHFLVQGCDVWLNNPRKPLEASGTSGMKASINGVVHLSVSDGWWAEAHNGRNGWTIEPDVATDDYTAQDAADAEALYRLLEQQVVPAFYERDERGTPTRWVKIVKEAIRTVTPGFSARRMLKQYAEGMYVPLMRREVVR